MTLPARASTETKLPDVAPGGYQQPSSRLTMATSDRNVPPSPHTNDTPQNRAVSGDRPSLRPTLRQRRRSPSTSPGTAEGEGRRATNSTPAEGLISSRTRARTPLTAAISARSSDGGRRRHRLTGFFHRVSPHQPMMAGMESSATHSQSAP